MIKAVEVKNLFYKYPDGTVAVNNVSFSIEENETIGIIGPNGAGKTTLLLCICGIIDFKGEVKIFGEKMSANNTTELKKKIGFVFQNPDDQLFMPTVFDDIAFGPLQFGKSKQEVQNIVKETLNLVGLEGFEERASHHLSLGEKKRVALATAVALKPKILILDEPTANLDPATRRELIDLLKYLNCTKIIAGHDLEIIKDLCNRIIIINTGRKIAEGYPSEIFTNRTFLLENRLI
ncbi:MAG: energy-coupling factor ABC transporter ATP-binding protein [Endomicrobiia bacterium]